MKVLYSYIKLLYLKSNSCHQHESLVLVYENLGVIQQNLVLLHESHININQNLVLKIKILFLRARRAKGFFIFKYVGDRGLVNEVHKWCILSVRVSVRRSVCDYENFWESKKIP